MENGKNRPKILILATETCAYPGADNTGQVHQEYPTNTYILRVPAPVLFSDDFYLHSLTKGIDGIIVMSCGHECPYEGAYTRLSKRVTRVQGLMKKSGIDPKRLRLCAVCTVCVKGFLKEVQAMINLLSQSQDVDGRQMC